MSAESDAFYADLPGFIEFPDVTDLSRYVPLPDDWSVVIADIKGSTKAIREGRYKEVNLMGAACITAVLNALPDYSAPYVFGGYNAPIYREELRTNSDFRRFDDMLRMILDCPTDKADAIEAFFSGLHDEGKIAFGTHRSEHALMTCLVFSLTKGEHVHFVDGSDGGFAMAAVGLEGQMKALVDGQVAR